MISLGPSRQNHPGARQGAVSLQSGTPRVRNQWAGRREATTNGEDVLNGMAYDPILDRLWVTGKLWPAVFSVRLITTPTPPPPGRASYTAAQLPWLGLATGVIALLGLADDPF